MLRPALEVIGSVECQEFGRKKNLKSFSVSTNTSRCGCVVSGNVFCVCRFKTNKAKQTA